MSLIDYLYWIPITLIILNLMVIVHEFGHFWVARRCGISTPEFSVGFGPLLAKTVVNDVQYSLRAIPLGGYVKIAGMDIALEGESKDEDLKNIPQHKLFVSLPLWKKLAIIVAGPINNLILAFISLIIIAIVLGVPYDLKTNKAVIGAIEFKSPAYEAGLLSGDEITSISGHKVRNWNDLVRIVNAAPKKSLDFTIRRKNQYYSVTIQPFYDPHYKVGRIGIQPPYIMKRLSFKTAVFEGVRQGLFSFKEIILALGRLVVGKERATGIGPIGMVGMMKTAADAGMFQLCFMFPMLNLFLGLFNILPIPLPLLDGGWVTILIIERLRKKDFTPEQKAMAQMIGIGLMLLLFVLITYGDITSQIKSSIHLRSK